MVKQGSGTETLTGANTYTGGTTINEGTLAIGGNGSLSGTGTVNLANAGTSLDLSGANAPQTIGGLAGAAGSSVSLGSTGLAFGDAGSHTFGGTIGGTGGVVKQGSGTETLTGTNTYTGGTTIVGGTLALGAGGSLAADGALNLGAPGSRFDISGSGANQTIGALSGVAGTTVALGGNGLTFGDASDQSFGGVISGTGGITKQGNGTETLTGVNTFTGGATVDAGTLAISGNGSLAAGNHVDLANAGAGFDISAANANQTIGALAGAAGTTVTLGSKTLTLGDSTSQSFGGAIGGTGAIVKQGSGTETLTGANTYTGGTTIAAGTLALGAGGSLAATGDVALTSAGAAFDISGAGANQTIGTLSGVAGTSVNLGGNGLTFGGTGFETFSGTIAGTGGITKQGSGTETLTGANTFTGGATINAGTLALGPGGSLAAGSSVNLANAGTVLDITNAGANQTIGGLSGAADSTVALGGNHLTFGDAGDETFGGTLIGTGGITKQGAGTETLTGANTFTGGVSVDAGTLALAGSGSLAAGTGVDLANAGAGFDISGASAPVAIGALAGAAGTSVNLGGNGLTFGDAGNETFGGAITGTGGITKEGTGTATLTGANTFTGGTMIDAGTLAIGAGGSLAAGSVLNLANAGTAFDISAATTPQAIGGLTGVAGTTVNLGGNGLALGDAGNETFGGTIAGTGGITKTGTGTETLTGTNTFTGGVSVDAGTLALAGSGSLAAGTGVNLANAGAAFDISGATAPVTLGALSGASGTTVNLGANGLSFGDAGSETFGGAITGTAGITKTGAGTETLTGANTFTGGTTVNAGTLALAGNGSLAAGSALNLANAGAAFDISGAGSPQTLGALSGTAGSTVNLGANGLTFGDAGNETFGGTIAGTAGITKQGTGTTTLTGANTFTGGATIDAGTLAIGAGGSLAAGSALNLANAGTAFDISGAGAPQTLGALSGAAGTSVNLGANGLTFGDAGDETFGGTIAGTAGITKQGTGTATLTGANMFTGGATVNAGTLALGAGGSLASGSALDLANAGAAFDISDAGAPQALGALSGAAGTSVNLGANGLMFGDAGSETFGGAIAGTAGITKQGTGTATLTGANTFTGGTTIDAGTLALGAGGSLAATGDVTLAGLGAAFDISGATTPQTIGGLAGGTGSTVNLGGNTLTLGGAGNTRFDGTLTGGGALVKAGTGIETLGADNTYSGGTTLTGGTLVVGSNGALGSGALNVNGPATLDAATAVTLANGVNLNTTATIGGSQDLTLAGTVSGTGGLVKNGDAALTLNGGNTYSGGTTLNAGSIALGNAQALGDGALTVNGGRLLLGATRITLRALNGAAAGVIDTGTGSLEVAGGGSYAGVMTGAGSLAKSGTGTLTLTGENTYSGGTTISGGTLQVGDGGSAGSLTGDVANNGALVFARADSLRFAGLISGTGSLTQSGTGELTLAGNNTLSGPTTVAAGALNVTGSLAQSIVTVNSGATLTGTGTIGGLVVGSGATAAASQPGAALNVAGSVTFQPGSTLQVAATPQQSGALAATGSAQLLGGTVQVLANAGIYSPATRYTIVDAGGGLNGVFSGVTSNLAFLRPLLSYDANRVLLQLIPNGSSFTDAAATSNQRNVAAAIGTLGNGNPLFDTVLSSDAATARRAYDALDGELYASIKSMLLTDSRYVRDAVTNRLRQGLGAGSGPLAALASGGASQCGDATTVLSGPAGAAAAQQRCQGSRYQPVVWGQAFGGRSRLAGDGNASDISRSMTGFIAGADVGLNEHWRAGVAGGVTHSSFDNDLQSSASADSYSVSVYGGGQYGPLGVRGGAAYTWHRIDGDRYPAFAGFSDHTQSGVNAQTAQVFGEVGYALPAGALAFEPFAGLAYVNLHTDAMSETGGAAALQSAGESNSIGFSTAGVRAATQLNLLAKGSLTARAMAGWRHAFGATTPGSTFAFTGGGASFQVAGVPIARDAAVMELGLDASLTQRLSLGLTYSGQYGGGVRDNAVLGNLLWKF